MLAERSAKIALLSSFRCCPLPVLHADLCGAFWQHAKNPVWLCGLLVLVCGGTRVQQLAPIMIVTCRLFLPVLYTKIASQLPCAFRHFDPISPSLHGFDIQSSVFFGRLRCHHWDSSASNDLRYLTQISQISFLEILS